MPKGQSVPSPLSPPPSLTLSPPLLHRALQLLTQLSRNGQALSAVGPALQQLLNSDLSAKWWTQGTLETRDVITEMEFFDPGLVWYMYYDKHHIEVCVRSVLIMQIK